MSEEWVIETKNLSKQYKSKFAVNNVSIRVKRGDIYGLIGKNGAGKTTLMKLILGLTAPTSGEVCLFGNSNTSAVTSSRSKIGSLIEDPGLYKNCTAYENMLRFSILYGADKGEINDLLKLVNLDYTGSKKAGAFSLGMKQRLGIAIALLSHPEVLVLDEPINGLDPAGIKEIRDLILRLNRERGVTFIISSHLLDELAKVVTCYGILSDGVLTQQITASELEEQCRHFARLTVSDPVRATELLKGKFEDVQLAERGVDSNAENGHVITLYNYIDHTAEINDHLVKSGIAVSEITVSTNGTEEFFIERLGR